MYAAGITAIRAEGQVANRWMVGMGDLWAWGGPEFFTSHQSSKRQKGKEM